LTARSCASVRTPQTRLAASSAANFSTYVSTVPTDELRGYHIQGSDEAIGHVEDFVVDDESWTVRYLHGYYGAPAYWASDPTPASSAVGAEYLAQL